MQIAKHADLSSLFFPFCLACCTVYHLGVIVYAVLFSYVAQIKTGNRKKTHSKIKEKRNFIVRRTHEVRVDKSKLFSEI